MRKSLIAGIIGLGLLVGCGTSPRDKCRSITSYSQLLALLEKIEQTEIDIERGYKVHYSKQPTTRRGTCATNTPGYLPIYYSCTKNSSMTVENPVSINVSVERQKLRMYERDYAELYPRAMREYDNCKAQSAQTVQTTGSPYPIDRTRVGKTAGDEQLYYGGNNFQNPHN